MLSLNLLHNQLMLPPKEHIPPPKDCFVNMTLRKKYINSNILKNRTAICFSRDTLLLRPCKILV